MRKVFTFTGIGSRGTPTPICDEMIKIGRWAQASGYLVRSGHARGADVSFEKGAGLNCDVFLPWRGFNSEEPLLGRGIVVGPDPVLDELVKRFHKSYHNLKPDHWKLHRRNGAQVLGLNADEPSAAIVCWRIKPGGTDQAIRIAQGWSVPIMNMADEKWNTSQKVIAELTRLAALESGIK